MASAKWKKINKSIIYFIFPVLILIGKIVRYTLMKNVLVDAGIGHLYLYDILYGDSKIHLLSSDSISSHSSGNAIVIFRLLNFGGLTNYTQFEIFISIIWNIILLVLIFSIKDKLSLKEFIFLALSVIVLNLYFLIIFYILNSGKKSGIKKYYLVIGVIVFAAISFRVYYFLIVLFMIVIHILFKVFILNKKKVKTKDIIFILLIIGLTYFLFLNYMKTAMPTEYRELLRVRLRASAARSDMRSIFMSRDLVIFTIDYLIMIVRMLFPVELFILGVKYIPYIIYQLIITFYVIKGIKNVKKNSHNKNIALYVYLGFVFASATFEPDFGSWVRHETVAFPVMVIISDLSRKESRASFDKNFQNLMIEEIKDE